jgi:protein gp37
MSDKSKIEWTDATWNPVRGCSIVSKGCTNCYAMRQAHRHDHPTGAYHGLTKLTRGGPVWTGEIRLVPELLDQPLKWQRPRRIFVNSMSDLFHEDVPGDFIDQVLDVIKRCQHLGKGHTFQVLTKRAWRMQRFMQHYRPTGNLWLGVSVEDQAAADERIPLLLQTPAAVRWISAEPLLGPIDLQVAKHGCGNLDWLVAGGESGPGARPMHPAWPRSLREQCAIARVPFFFKQWGAWAPCVDFPRHAAGDELKQAVPSRTGPPNGAERDFEWMVRLPKHIAGRELDGRTHDEYPA